MMTKELKADLLLCAAKHWQNREGRKHCCWEYKITEEILAVMPAYKDPAEWDAWASAALSEAARLGFDLENVQ